MNHPSAVGFAALSLSVLSTAFAEPASTVTTTTRTLPAQAAQVAPLMSQALVADPRKEIDMLTVSYPPGGSSAPHRHDAQVFVYVLEGTLTMQVQGKAAVTLHPGEVFYESPSDVHAVSANASRVAPAKFLVVMVKDKDRPASRPVAP